MNESVKEVLLWVMTTIVVPVGIAMFTRLMSKVDRLDKTVAVLEVKLADTRDVNRGLQSLVHSRDKFIDDVKGWAYARGFKPRMNLPTDDAWDTPDPDRPRTPALTMPAPEKKT